MIEGRGKALVLGRTFGTLVLVSLLTGCSLFAKKDDPAVDEITPPPSAQATPVPSSIEPAVVVSEEPAAEEPEGEGAVSAPEAGVAESADASNSEPAVAESTSPDKQGKRSERQLLRAAELSPESAEAQFNLGAFYQGSRQFSKAEDYYKKALDLKVDFIPAYVNLASIKRNSGQYARALDYLAEALTIAPNNSKVRNERVAVLRAMGRTKDAADEAHQLLTDNSNDLDAFINLALCYYDLENLEMSRLVFEKAMAAFPEVAEDSEVLHAYGRTLLAQGERELAIAAGFDRALKVSSSNASASINRAFLHLEDSEAAEAEKLLRTALESEPGNVPARMMLAIAQRRQGDFEGARSHYELILAADPDNIDAKYNLAVLFSNYMEMPQEAVDLFTEVKESTEDEAVIAQLDIYIQEATNTIQVLKRREKLKALRAKQAAEAAAAATPTPTPEAQEQDTSEAPSNGEDGDEGAIEPEPTPANE